MANRSHPTFALLALLGLGACAQGGAAGNATALAGAARTQATPAAAALSSAANAIGNPYDGTYGGAVGLPQQEGGSGTVCPPATGDRVIRVANSQFRAGLMTRTFNGPVASDGKVDLTSTAAGSSGTPGRITGQFTGNTFNGTFTFRYGTRANCTYELSNFTKR
jgi:hypothetical protein